MFSVTAHNLDREVLISQLANDRVGALVVFEGWVRDHNQGKKVSSLEYQVYRELALKEGQRILDEARVKFNLHDVVSVHREGHLQLGDVAVWIGATASHRDDAFKATRYIIDEIKHRLPVWKKEHYLEGKAEWVFCRHHHHHVHFEEADYYSKQQKLVEQTKLKQASVLVVGAGGLGCPVLVNLATAGIGKITIVDFDTIHISNIHRQFLSSPNLVGEKKAVVAASRLQELNPFIQVEAVVDSFRPEMINHDLVIDCTDSMASKFFIHDVCFKKKVPLISAGVFKSEGQLRTFIPGKGCWRCHTQATPDDTLLGNCNDFGVVGATTSVIGSLQASEAIEFLLRGTNVSFESTFYFNVNSLSPMKIKNVAKSGCSVCQGEVELQDDLEVHHVADAELIDIRHMSDDEVMNAVSDKKIVLCCHRGVRSKTLAQKLRSEGHQQVFSLRGGANTNLCSATAPAE